MIKFRTLVESRMADEKKQKYYQDNKDKRLAYQREYYLKNKFKIKKARDKRKAKDPDWEAKQREYNRDYYKKNKERIVKQRAKRAVA